MVFAASSKSQSASFLQKQMCEISQLEEKRYNKNDEAISKPTDNFLIHKVSVTQMSTFVLTPQ